MSAPAKYRVIAGGTDALPISLADIRRHLEQPIYAVAQVDDPDDDLILAKARAAMARAESFLGLALTPRHIELALDAFPTRRSDGHDWIELPWGPVAEIITVRAGVGTSDSDGTLAEDLYALDEFATPARLLPVASWPSVRGLNAVRVIYRTGYELDVDSDGRVQTAVPPDILAGILLLTGDLYANREDTVEGARDTLPNGVDALLRPHRMLLGMA